MKKFLSFFILLFLAKFYSQEYVPLLKEGNKWYELNIDYKFDGPSPLSRTYIIINGEETKNGIVYKKLFSNLYCYTPDKFFPCSATGNGDEFYKLIRENAAERKVYYFNEATNSDVLLYDFSLKVGDLIPSDFPFYAQNSLGSPDSSLSVVKIIQNANVFDKVTPQTFFADDIPYNNYEFSTKLYEGIGSNLGLLYRPGTKMFEGGHVLECFENTASGKSCNAVFLAAKEISIPKKFNLTYFKNNNSFKINGKSSEKFQLQLYDFSGKLLHTKNVISNVDFFIDHIGQKTTYIYKLTSSNSIITGKIIIP